MNFIRDFSEGAAGKRTKSILGRILLATLGAILGLVILAAFIWAVTQAHARDNGQWGDMPPNVRQWFQSLMQPDNPHMSCCGEADAYEADTFEIDGDHYVAVITDGKGVMPPGTRITVPNAKMKWDGGNPSGHGWLFLAYDGHVYCYVTPGGV